MATFASDTFTGTDGTALSAHTPVVGGSWVKHSASATDMYIAGNRVRNDTSSNLNMYYNNGAPASADYTVSADLQIVSANGSQIGVAGRIATGATTAYIFIRQDSHGAWELYSVVAASYTMIGSTTEAVTVGNSYAVALVMTGTSIVGTVNGVTKASATNSAVTAAGKAGIWAYDSEALSTGIHLDNFVAADPVVAGKARPIFQQPWRRWTARRIAT